MRGARTFTAAEQAGVKNELMAVAKASWFVEKARQAAFYSSGKNEHSKKSPPYQGNNHQQLTLTPMLESIDE